MFGEHDILLVCRNQAAAAFANKSGKIDAISIYSAMPGCRWDVIICPHDIARSDSVIEREALSALRDDLELKLRPGGHMIWV